jgi:adenosylcobyric acid synthase
MTLRGALLVAGTTSDAGKSVLTAGLCRALARRGVRVAPFKAQNMSLNSFVTASGAEIGRAQAMQAQAAGIEPDARMNPVLLKPGSDMQSHVIVLGQPAGEASATSYREHADTLRKVALDSLASLRAEYDVVICEGAGSPAEINLRDTDIANMGLARAAGIPVIVVGDIDRGGVFAALYGTLALLSPADQALISGFVINKFRGDAGLLQPGLGMLTGLTGRPVLGVLPWLEGLALDMEDSLALDAARPAMAAQPPGAGQHQRAFGSEVLRVSVLRTPRISNFTDVDALAAEPGVLVRFAASPAELADADLVILPGTRATVADLGWLRERGLAAVVADRARAGRPVLGICGGYQMLGAEIDDPVESRAGRVAGLDLLPLRAVFGPDKVLGQVRGTGYGGPVTGYAIHHGVVQVTGQTGPFPGGCRSGAVFGTAWHGTLECDDFRRAFLAEVAALAGRDFTPQPDTSFAAIRQARLDTLADLVADHLDQEALDRLITHGAPPDLPVIAPAGPGPAVRDHEFGVVPATPNS